MTLLYFIGLISYIPTGTGELGPSQTTERGRRELIQRFRFFSSVGAYFTLTIRELGFSTFQTNLMSAPAALLTILLMTAVSLYSDKVNSRALVALLGASWQIAVSYTTFVFSCRSCTLYTLPSSVLRGSS